MENKMRNEHSSGILLKIYHQISSYNTNTATLQPSSVASNTITCVVQQQQSYPASNHTTTTAIQLHSTST